MLVYGIGHIRDQPTTIIVRPPGEIATVTLQSRQHEGDGSSMADAFDDATDEPPIDTDESAGTTAGGGRGHPFRRSQQTVVPAMDMPTSSMIITLDVGGLIFKTTPHTLVTHEDSYFDRMVAALTPPPSAINIHTADTLPLATQEGRPREGASPATEQATKLPYKSAERPSSSSKIPHTAATQHLFIDRSGEHFHHIIAYLRDRCPTDLPQSFHTLRELRREAAFYGLRSLVADIDDRLTSVDRVIRLSVGGIEHQVTARTLLRAPHESILHQIGLNEDCVPKDEEGRPFIDRDGALFQFVLEYLRSGEMSSLPSDFGTDRQIARRFESEARYYRIAGMLERVYDRLHPWRHAFEGHRHGHRNGYQQQSPAHFRVALTPGTLSREGSCGVPPTAEEGDESAPRTPSLGSAAPQPQAVISEMQAVQGPHKKLDTVSI